MALHDVSNKQAHTIVSKIHYIINTLLRCASLRALFSGHGPSLTLSDLDANAGITNTFACIYLRQSLSRSNKEDWRNVLDMSADPSLSPLLAVLLVTSSSRGPTLSFRYPRRPKVEKRYSKVKYLVAAASDDGFNKKLDEDEMDEEQDADSVLSEDLDDERSSSEGSSSGDETGTEIDGQNDATFAAATARDQYEVASSAGGTAATREAISTSAAAERARRKQLAYQQYLGYECDILASLLAPKREMCHQKFELIIDDLAFVGHPVCASKSGQWESRAEDNVDIARKNSDFAGDSIGTPVDAAVSSTSMPMNLFHLVLVLDRPDPSADTPALDLTSWLQMFYDNIALKMTTALLAEEARCAYVSQECEKISQLRERCMDDGQSYVSFLTHAVHVSSLASTLQKVYSSISLSSNVFITINDSIDAHLQLPPMLQDPKRMMKIADLETPVDMNDPIYENREDVNTESKRTTGPILLPWKTLLLPHDEGEADEDGDKEEEEGIKTGEENNTAALSRRFASLFKPTLEGMPCVADAADLLDWSVDDDVYPMVQHLIYYREARIVDVPRVQNYYAISPLFELSELPRLSISWSTQFPTLLPLPAFLALLSSALRPFSTQIKRRDQRQLCLDALVWLLRYEVVVQMHVRLRLIANETCKLRAARARGLERERIRQKHAVRAKRTERDSKSAAPPLGDFAQSAPAYHDSTSSSVKSEHRGRRPNDASKVSALRATRSTKTQQGNGAQKEEVLHFERRPVLRSRSPSRILALGGREAAPRGRMQDVGEHDTQRSDVALPSSVPSLLRSIRDEGRRRRSPSVARLRVTGFGNDEEVYVEDQGKSPPAGATSLPKHPEEGQPRTDDTTAKLEPDDEDDVEDDASYLQNNKGIAYETWESQPIATVISEPSRATDTENEWIVAMVQGRDVWLTERLYALLPFLNGKHTVDEIVYRLQWRRKDLRAVLNEFRDDILTFVHP